MADKQPYLDYLQKLGASGVLTSDEILAAFKEGEKERSAEQSQTTNPTDLKITPSDVFGLAGALIVVLSIALLVAQNWGSLNLFTKLFSTLGVAIVAYYVGVTFSRKEQLLKVSFAFHLISALIMPVGIYVLLDVINPGSLQSPWWQVVVSAILTIFYGLSYLKIQKNAFFLFFILLFGGTLFYSICGAMYGDVSRNAWDYLLPQYIFAVLGLSYALLGHSMSRLHQRLGGFVNFVGVGLGLLSLLIASYSGPMIYNGGLGDTGTYNGTPWNFWTVVYALLPILVLYYSVRVRNSWLLYLGTAFLMFYMIFVSLAYFSGSLGWPLAMMVCGLVLIGLGYFSVNLSKHFKLKLNWKRAK